MSAYSDKVIADGAVAYWKLDESSGTVAHSTVGSYDGTISGGVTLGQPGAIQGYTAMAFDGASGKIVTAQPVPILAPFTLEGWFRLSGSGIVVLLSTRAGYPAIDDVNFWIQGGNGQPTITLDYANGTSPQQNIIFAADYTDGQWHHFAVTVAALTCNLYLDGVVRQSASLPAIFAGATYPVTISNDAFTGFGVGLIDEVAIYHTELTPQQIAAHYQARTAWPDPPYIANLPPVVYPGFNAISNQWAPLTPNDAVDAPFGKLWIGGAGNLALVGADGRVVTFAGVKAGTMLPLAGRRINATNTTASNILALRTQ